MVQTAIIADDHEIVAASVRAILDELGVAVAGRAADGLAAIDLVKRHRPALLVLDIAMPGAKGIEVFTEARRWSPKTKIAVLTGLSSRGLLQQFAASDVEALMLKSQSAADIRDAVSGVLGGARYRSAELMRQLEKMSEAPVLTPREMQILSRIASGHNNREIAAALSISAKTVDRHRSNLMAKLGVHSVAELMAFALREGLLEPAKHL